LIDKISCIPLVNSEDNIVGALTKSDIMNAIAVRGEGAIDEIMDSAVNVSFFEFYHCIYGV
jgi:predicted transcriptional regulator